MHKTSCAYECVSSARMREQKVTSSRFSKTNNFYTSYIYKNNNFPFIYVHKKKKNVKSVTLPQLTFDVARIYVYRESRKRAFEGAVAPLASSGSTTLQREGSI